MSTHLSDEQIAKYLSGEESASSEAHMAACEACRAEAQRLLCLVGTMKAHVERASERHTDSLARQRFQIRGSLAAQRPQRRTWALAAALALLVFTSTFMFQSRAPRIETITNLPPTAISDEALLSAVDSALEQDVPSALAPLQKLAFEREQAERDKTGNN